MAHRGRPPAPRSILPPGVGLNPLPFLLQLEMPLKVVHTTITNSFIKYKFRVIHGTSDDNFTDYLAEFIWRKKFKEHVFGNLLACIREQYPV